VGIAPGVGGKIWYVFKEGVQVIAEGVLGTEEDRFPLYVLQLEESASFEVHRDGELGDLPTKMVFKWDGQELKLV
jgi:hypothetical protein